MKCVQDIDTVGQRQYSADLLGMHNGQAIVRGDLMPRCSEAAIVPGDPSTRTIPCMGTTWQSDMTLHSSDHQRHHWLSLARVPLRYRGPTTLGPPVGP
jgi:hypothetical protein